MFPKVSAVGPEELIRDANLIARDEKAEVLSDLPNKCPLLRVILKPALGWCSKEVLRQPRPHHRDKIEAW